MNQNHTRRIIGIIFVALILLAGSFSGGLLVGKSLPSKLDILFAPLFETRQYLLEQFIDQPVDDTKLVQGAIRGMIDSLGDEHSGYMNPEEYLEATTPLIGSFGGIGAYVDVTQEYLTIISAMPGSPAEQAGLKSGDEIIKVDGKDVTGIDPEVVLKSVKGLNGTQVTLTIKRPESAETFDVTLTRQDIDIPSVISEMKEGDIGYVYLTTFGEKTNEELEAALQTLLAQNPKGLILDLRYNSGGYLTTAVEVISQFIPDGNVMIEQQGNGEETVYTAVPGGLATNIPLVVLVNEGSASASEITAGAIQDLGRGIIVGVTSYGKGSVQNWIPLENDQGAIRITVARWLTPNHRQINDAGLTPDVLVELTQADIDAGIDAQLNKAIEILHQSE